MSNINNIMINSYILGGIVLIVLLLVAILVKKSK